MEKETPNYYAIIPANVRYDKRLQASSKMLYGEITTLYNCKDYCFSKICFKNAFGLSLPSIAKCFNQLLEYGYIVKKDIDIVKELKNKNLNGFGFGDEICEWCGIKTVGLHKHHYPVPKSKGGKETVSICGNCHSEYHYSELYQLNISDNEFKEMISERKKYEGE